MELAMSATQTRVNLCSFHHPICNQSSFSNSVKGFYSDFVLGNGGIDKSTKRWRNRVLAVSKTETYSTNGRLRVSNKEKGSEGQEKSNPSIEELVSNNYLHRLVKNEKLEEGFKLLENMSFRGDVPDTFLCTSLISRFCRIGDTKKASRIMEILEESRAVLDVITYNVLIRGLCKSREINSALRVLDRMSVEPDVVTYNTILCALCDNGKLKEAMKVLDRQLEKGCYPDVVTYTILIEAACKESGVGEAMKLLDEMRIKGFKPDVVTYNVLINGVCREGRLGDAVKFLNNMPSSYGCPRTQIIRLLPRTIGLCFLRSIDSRSASCFLHEIFVALVFLVLQRHPSRLLFSWGFLLAASLCCRFEALSLNYWSSLFSCLSWIHLNASELNLIAKVRIIRISVGLGIASLYTGTEDCYVTTEETAR